MTKTNTRTPSTYAVTKHVLSPPRPPFSIGLKRKFVIIRDHMVPSDNSSDIGVVNFEYVYRKNK